MCHPSYPKSKSERDLNGTEKIMVRVSSTSTGYKKTDVACADEGDKGVYLQMFRSWLMQDNASCYIRGILDGGRQCTFIKKELVEKLNQKVLRNTKIALNAFASIGTTTIESQCGGATYQKPV